MKKIAILLKGQARMTEEGAKLFNKTILERYGDKYDIKVFAATWNALAEPMMTKDTKERSKDKYSNQRIISNEEAFELIKGYNPSWYRVIQQKDLFDIVVKTVRAKYEYNPIHTWIRDHFFHNQYKQGTGAYLIAPPERYTITDDDKIVYPIHYKQACLGTHYVLGQIYAAGKAFDCLEEWRAHTDNMDWIPDVVWVTRFDAFNWIGEPDGLWSLMRRFEIETKTNILTKEIHINKAKMFVDDVNFYMSYESACEAFSNIGDRIYNTLVYNYEHLLGLIDSGDNFQHHLWPAILNHMDWRPCWPHQGADTFNVLRPMEGLDEKIQEILDTPNENWQHLSKLFSQLDHFVMTYDHPSGKLDTTADTILDAYDKFSKN